MTDLLGPAAENAVTTRPARVIERGADDTWFKDCSGPTEEDGTRLGADYLNDVLAQIRHAVRGMGIAIGTYSDDFLRDAILAASVRYAVDTGTTNAVVASVTPPPVAYYAGLIVSIKLANAITGAATANLNGLGDKAIKRQDGSNPVAGDGPAGAKLLLLYDGSVFTILSATSGGAIKTLRTGDMVLALGTSARSDGLALIGGTFSRSLYADLWTWIQASAPLVDDSDWLNATLKRWGSFSRGDGASTFRVPDLRGEFMRFLDGGRGVDVGRVMGVAQADEIRAHSHPAPPGTNFAVQTPPGYENMDGSDHDNQTFASATGSFGGVETRPRNVTLVPFIIY